MADPTPGRQWMGLGWRPSTIIQLSGAGLSEAVADLESAGANRGATLVVLVDARSLQRGQALARPP